MIIFGGGMLQLLQATSGERFVEELRYLFLTRYLNERMFQPLERLTLPPEFYCKRMNARNGRSSRKTSNGVLTK